MLGCMESRGSDSVGFAIYGAPVLRDRLLLTLQRSTLGDWDDVADWLTDATGEPLLKPEVRHSHATFNIPEKAAIVAETIDTAPLGVKVMSLGRRMRIFKEAGAPRTMMEAFGMSDFTGTHAIGHTRMATESAVLTAGAHPFSTGRDFCLVHNGSLSNHHWLKRRLQREGIRFHTENDSEVAAGFFTWRLREGDTLEEAMARALVELDGFYTFCIGTETGFAVLRDPIACKPAVIAETDDYVAMASEYRSLADLPGAEHAHIWEPEPAVVYAWDAELLPTSA